MRLQILSAGLLAAGVACAADTPVTFNKDVLPILQKNCQGCHRPGQMGPMSFLTYQSARPWAKAMKAAVLTKKMPPWSADEQYGPYLNDRSLQPSEIEIIAKWADSGAAEGNPQDAPPPVQWADGWVIQPDVIVDGPVTEVPAKTKNNVVEWITVVMPTGFTKDTWLTSV
ncbi:MAG TPA: cytochrome c, partial [Bryobacteraceae bacterium]|nr:cytochrome c [Bryobacteraceae bacterium]